MINNSSLEQKINNKKWRKFKENYAGYVYMIPVLVGILGFTILPMVLSLIYSFHDYYPLRVNNQLVNPGFQNYIRMFTDDRDSVLHSIFITFRYSIVTVVISMVGSYCLSLFLNQDIKGMKVFRVIFYLPCLIPAIASTLLWKDITKINSGYINLILDWLNLPQYTFYEDVNTVFPTIIMLSFFGFGGSSIMWLAQMKNVPRELYEAAEIDGANYFQKLFNITIPMTTSMIFYQLITHIIGSLQVFGGFYPLRNGICDSEIDFIVVKIYREAFENSRLSYACALSWLLFVIIGVITSFIFKTSKWVYYGEER